jgi:hypothetical protein
VPNRYQKYVLDTITSYITWIGSVALHTKYSLSNLAIHGLSSRDLFLLILGSYQSYFLLIFERILAELLVNYDKLNSHSTYGLILVNILQKLVSSNDSNTLEQILNTESVRQQFHALLYTCLCLNNNDIPLVIRLWNIYGRIL